MFLSSEFKAIHFRGGHFKCHLYFYKKKMWSIFRIFSAKISQTMIFISIKKNSITLQIKQLKRCLRWQTHFSCHSASFEHNLNIYHFFFLLSLRDEWIKLPGGWGEERVRRIKGKKRSAVERKKASERWRGASECDESDQCDQHTAVFS